MLEYDIEATLARLIEIGPRAPGSWAELKAAEFIHGKLCEFGYDARIERFVAGSHNAEVSLLELEGSTEEFPSLPTQFAAAGDVTGELLYLGNSTAPLVGMDALSGKIGLLFPSGPHSNLIPFVLELEKAGLAGLVVISSQMDNLETKLVRYPEVTRLPIAVVSWRTGNRLVRLEGQTARLRITQCATPRGGESQNVVAELPGTGAARLIVSAHHDTAAYAPGPLDNGGGTAMLLELAKRLAGKQFPATITFVSSGSEENGGDDCCGAGAKAFYASRMDWIEQIVAHVEVDDIGNLVGVPGMVYGGPKGFTDAAFNAAIRASFGLKTSHSPSCDHGIAVKNGLPFVFVCDAGAVPRPCYHSPEDTLDFMSIAKCAWHMPFILGMVERLAASRPFLPYVRDGERLIRPARYADHDAIADITKAAFGPVCMAKLREDHFGEEIGGAPWHVHKSAGVLGGIRSRPYDAIVCEIARTVVGYATLGLNRGTGIAEIGNNAVHPDWQGRGIGSAMQREVARRMDAEGFTRFAVSTLTNDLPAQHVYEKLGYKQIVGTVHYLRENG